MNIEVRTKEELNSALQNKENIIVVKGKLAKKLKPLAIIKKSNKKIDINENMSNNMAVASLTGIAGISVAVAITLIITIGVVSIVAILKNYDVVIKNDEIRLERD